MQCVDKARHTSEGNEDEDVFKYAVGLKDSQNSWTPQFVASLFHVEACLSGKSAIYFNPSGFLKPKRFI